MPFDASKFVNPGQFADYSSYSGMGGDQQMKSLKQVAAEALGAPSAGGSDPDQAQTQGIIPPSSMSGIISQQFDKAIAPIQQKASNISNAWDQASQGNGVAAYNAYRGVAQPASQQNVINEHYGVQQ